jgi:hypothetical protein
MNKDKNIEEVYYGGEILVYIVRSGVVDNLDSTLFITPNDASLQVGVSVHCKNSEIVRHEHLPIVRNLIGTSEVVFVRKGKCEVSIYNCSRVLVDIKVLNGGDIVVLMHGGHSFKMLEDTDLFEVKQGPYAGEKDKERW